MTKITIEINSAEELDKIDSWNMCAQTYSEINRFILKDDSCLLQKEMVLSEARDIKFNLDVLIEEKARSNSFYQTKRLIQKFMEHLFVDNNGVLLKELMKGLDKDKPEAEEEFNKFNERFIESSKL